MKEEKNGLVVPFIIIIIILLLGLAGYLCYDKFWKKTDNTRNEKKEQAIKELSSPINSLEDLKNLNFADEHISASYWNYDDLVNYYLKMNTSGFDKNNIDDLKDYLKIENGKLYWLVGKNWQLDKKINGKILYVNVTNSGYDGECTIAIYTDSGYIYIISGSWTGEEDFSYNEWINDLIYYEVKYTGTLKNVKYKEFCDCECGKAIYLDISNQIFVLHADYGNGSLTEFKGYKLTPVEDYIDSFEYANKYCGSRTYRLGVDGYLIDIFDDNNQKIKVKDYISVSYDEPFALIIDETNNLYVMYFTTEDYDDMAIKKIDTIKDSKFVYQDDEKSYGYIILSDGYKMEFNDFYTFFHE